MRLLLSFLTAVAFFLNAASGALAQVPTKPATDSPEQIASRAMKAMELLEEAPGSTGPELAKDGDGSGNRERQKPLETRLETETGVSASVSLLPPAPREGARGIDMMSRARLDVMIPSGRSHRGVRYPMYRPLDPGEGPVGSLPIVPAEGEGQSAPLASLFESDMVTRLDDDHIQFDRAKWQQFDNKPGPDGITTPTMSLEIERGVYDLKNEVLMTNQPVRIENRQFLITGDTMVHDRASSLTRLTGRVKMTFFNDDPPPAPVPQPPAPDANKPRNPETPHKP